MSRIPFTSHWRLQAQGVIQREIAAWFAAHGEAVPGAFQFRDTLAAADRDALFRHVNAAYPFGPRENHPYEIWRSEMRALRRRLGLAAPPPSPRRKPPKAAQARGAAGQRSLEGLD